MSYREWKYWLFSLPWHLKWFVLLVLVRPLVDNFYYLKNVSPFLSPLYIVGVMTPVLCLFAVLKYRYKDWTVIDFLFSLWSFFVLLSLFFVFLFDAASKEFLEYFLKLTMPIYLFFFLRLLIRSRKDLDGVLQTFLYSSLFVVAVFLFEIFVNPIKVQKTRDIERIQGSFGDVLNYAIYLSQGFLIVCYFYFSRKNSLSLMARNRMVILTAVICIACLFKISHTATYGVFLSVLGLFILFNVKTNKTAGFAIIVVVFAVAYLFAGDALEKNVMPLLKTDIAVYEGKKENSKLLHGRVGRWQKMMAQFFDFPVEAQFFGMPLTFTSCYAEIGTGSHNDFVRILFFTGFSGLVSYLLIISNLFTRIKYLLPAQHFLALGAMAILILYSISTCPTLYAPMLYILFSVVCYLCLPVHVLKEADE